MVVKNSFRQSRKTQTFAGTVLIEKFSMRTMYIDIHTYGQPIPKKLITMWSLRYFNVFLFLQNLMVFTLSLLFSSYPLGNTRVEKFVHVLKALIIAKYIFVEKNKSYPIMSVISSSLQAWLAQGFLWK